MNIEPEEIGPEVPEADALEQHTPVLSQGNDELPMAAEAPEYFVAFRTLGTLECVVAGGGLPVCLGPLPPVDLAFGGSYEALGFRGREFARPRWHCGDNTCGYNDAAPQHARLHFR